MHERVAFPPGAAGRLKVATDLDARKQALIASLTEDYAQGRMDLVRLETALARVTGCATEDALAAEAAALGLSVPAAARAPDIPEGPPVERSCVSGHIDETGLWLRARRHRYALTSSVLKLDLRAYAGASGLRLELELAAISSSIRLLLPPGFALEDRIAERASSVVKVRGEAGPSAANAVVLLGSLRSSMIKANYEAPSRPRRSLSDLLFGRRRG